MLFKSFFKLCLLNKNIRYASNIVPNRLSGKVALITASSQGIGFEIAKRLALEGAKVMISSRKQEKVHDAVLKLEKIGISAIGSFCNVANAKHRAKVLEMTNRALGGIDILVLNAGINIELNDVLDTSDVAFGKIFEVNVKSTFSFAKETVPYLKKRSNGKIVLVSSIAAYQPLELAGTYSVSKTALLGFTKAAALQLAKDNITVNTVAPGLIETKFSEAMRTGPLGNKNLSLIPMKRFGKPEEVAGVVAYLASDDANYVTGETICVTGGMKGRF